MFGGRCTLQRWVDRYFEPVKRECVGCISYDRGQCQVVDGIEAAPYCEPLRELIRYEGIVLYGKAKKLMEGKG